MMTQEQITRADLVRLAIEFDCFLDDAYDRGAYDPDNSETDAEVERVVREMRERYKLTTDEEREYLLLLKERSENENRRQ